jgi:signal transduction histidine kinase
MRPPSEFQDPLSLHRLAALGQLTADIVHDFNNLLAVINASAYAALSKVTDIEVRQCLDDILGAGTRAAKLTNQVAEFLRCAETAPGESDANRVVAQAANVLRRLLGTNARLTFALSPQPLIVRFSSTHLEQILLNLVVNARDAMPDGGDLSIETSAFVCDDSSAATRAGVLPGEYALVTVADTGCGIDQATLPRIFDPYFTTKRGIGSGLGLSTVLRLVTAGGGRILVESRPTAGTTFRVFLPLIEQTQVSGG